MNTMKKRIRLIVLIAVVAVMAVAAILHFSLEPADYRVEIHKQTAAALTLLEEAVTGNDEGQYSEDAVWPFRRRWTEPMNWLTALCPPQMICGIVMLRLRRILKLLRDRRTGYVFPLINWKPCRRRTLILHRLSR